MSDDYEVRMAALITEAVEVGRASGDPGAAVEAFVAAAERLADEAGPRPTITICQHCIREISRTAANDGSDWWRVLVEWGKCEACTVRLAVVRPRGYTVDIVIRRHQPPDRFTRREYLFDQMPTAEQDRWAWATARRAAREYAAFWDVDEVELSIIDDGGQVLARRWIERVGRSAG